MEKLMRNVVTRNYVDQKLNGRDIFYPHFIDVRHIRL